MPDIRGCALIASASSSITREKISGESGHLCLVPLVMLKGVEVMPEVCTLTEGEEYSSKIALAKVPCKPNFCSTSLRYSQCTLSNAFSVSRERSKEVVQCCFAH